MITALLVVFGLLVMATISLWLAALHEEREHQRRELHRRLVVQAAEQRMQAIDRAALNAMFDAARGRWPS